MVRQCLTTNAPIVLLSTSQHHGGTWYSPLCFFPAGWLTTGEPRRATQRGRNCRVFCYAPVNAWQQMGNTSLQPSANFFTPPSGHISTQTHGSAFSQQPGDIFNQQIGGVLDQVNIVGTITVTPQQLNNLVGVPSSDVGPNVRDIRCVHEVGDLCLCVLPQWWKFQEENDLEASHELQEADEGIWVHKQGRFERSRKNEGSSVWGEKNFPNKRRLRKADGCHPAQCTKDIDLARNLAAKTYQATYCHTLYANG